MTNPIEYLQSKGFRITSDPNEYREWYPDGPRHKWGYRNLWEWHNGRKIYHDNYSDGWHRAYDVSDREGATIPAVIDGVIVDGTRQNGNFGGTVVLADHEGDYQYIYGHVKNITVKVGDKVKQGDKLAEQSNTNYYNNPMNSHLHFQTQVQKYYATEKAFVINGIDPLKIDVTKYTGGKFNSSEENVHTVKKGDTLWSIAQSNNTTVDAIKKENSLKNDTLSIGQKLKIKSKPPDKQQATNKFNKMTNRKLRNNAYFMGTIDKLGAEVRNKSGNNFNKKAGYSLKPGDTAYIFQVAGKGWGKIYTSRTSGNGSNDWIWLERLNVTKTF